MEVGKSIIKDRRFQSDPGGISSKELGSSAGTHAEISRVKDRKVQLESLLCDAHSAKRVKDRQVQLAASPASQLVSEDHQPRRSEQSRQQAEQSKQARQPRQARQSRQDQERNWQESGSADGNPPAVSRVKDREVQLETQPQEDHTATPVKDREVQLAASPASQQARGDHQPRQARQSRQERNRQERNCQERRHHQARQLDGSQKEEADLRGAGSLVLGPTPQAYYQLVSDDVYTSVDVQPSQATFNVSASQAGLYNATNNNVSPTADYVTTPTLEQLNQASPILQPSPASSLANSH